ncbi:Fic family protein [Pseudomonas fluorescens]|uniref:Fic family protein n=1 Tax=Pseudomonas fluorescens TaxID=294 RepID=UPI001930E351|nr:Fic family protein [Pseudomonas fluorescens]
MITGVHWLEPLIPSPVSLRLLDRASDVFECANHLKRSTTPGQLLEKVTQARINNSHFSCLIEGIDSGLSSLAGYVPWKSYSTPPTPAQAHMRAQAHFEKLEVFSPVGESSLGDVFAPSLIESLHQYLFEPLSQDHLLLSSGGRLIPGQTRSHSQRQVAVGRHEAPCWTAVNAMLKRMHQAYGMQREPRHALIACLAFHHRLAYVHPFDDGNGRVGRLLLHLQLQRLGLEPSLWSVSKVLYERREGYYASLANADQPRRGDLDGRGQLSQAGLVGFIEFMLGVLMIAMSDQE